MLEHLVTIVTNRHIRRKLFKYIFLQVTPTPTAFFHMSPCLLLESKQILVRIKEEFHLEALLFE